MAVNTIDRNILDVRSGLICHQVNCQGRMGRGIAKALSDKYTAVKTEYVKLCSLYDRKWEMLGNTQAVTISDNLTIINMFGQLDTGTDYRRTEYGSLKTCFYAIKKTARSQNMVVYFPYKVSCGLAGGDWDIVSNMIEHYFSDIETYICKI